MRIRRVEMVKITKRNSFLVALIDTNLGRGVRGLDSRDRTFVPFTRFRDVSRDFAPPTPALLGDRSL